MRAEEQGAQRKHVSAADEAKKVQELLVFEQERKALLASPQGVERAADEILRLYSRLSELIQEIQSSSPKLVLEFAHDTETFAARTLTVGLTLHWGGRYTNTLEYSRLLWRLWPHQVIFPGEKRIYLIDPKPSSSAEISADFSRGLGWCWNLSDKLWSTDQLSEHIAKTFVHTIKKL